MEKNKNFNILTLTTPDVENGLGCRVTIWCAGCSHHCPGCHNQHTWSYNQGKCIEDPNVIESILKEAEKPYIKGITFSGGDPLDQSYEALQQLERFIKIFKEELPGKDIWIYSGEVFEELIKTPVKRRILKKCDFLVDGPFIQELKDPDLPFRGSKNQRIIDLSEKQF